MESYLVAPAPTADMLSVPEAAAVMGVSASTMWRWIGAGRVSACRVGPKRVRLRRGDLDELIRERRPRERRLTDADVAAWEAAIAGARELREMLFERRAGVLMESSEVLLREARDERTEQLMSWS